jgi:hypothetical protein
MAYKSMWSCAGNNSDLSTVLYELRHTREDVARESELFDDPNVPKAEKSSRLLFLFVRDLMDGINGNTITPKLSLYTTDKIIRV